MLKSVLSAVVEGRLMSVSERFYMNMKFPLERAVSHFP